MSPQRIKLGPVAFSLPDLPPWALRYGKYAGYPGFGLLIFVIVLYLSLPFGKIKDRIEVEVASAGYDAEISSLGPAFLLGVKARDVVLRTRPRAPGEKAVAIALSRVVVKVGLFGLLVRHPSVDFDVEGLGGEIEGTVEQGRRPGCASRYPRSR